MTEKKDEKKKLKKRVRLLHLPFKEREYFTENLALLMKAAVPIGEALESLTASLQTRAFKKALTNVKEDIDTGYNLGDALERSGVDACPHSTWRGVRQSRRKSTDRSRPRIKTS